MSKTRTIEIEERLKTLREERKSIEKKATTRPSYNEIIKLESRSSEIDNEILSLLAEYHSLTYTPIFTSKETTLKQ